MLIKKIILFVLILLAGYLLWDELRDDTPRESATGDFEAFYHRFHTDSDFQLQHIEFPLPGRPAHVAEKQLDETDFEWSRHDWKLHQLPDPNHTEFKRLIDTDGTVQEWIWIKGSDQAIVRRWKPQGDSWQLIYYANVNPVPRQ